MRIDRIEWTPRALPRTERFATSQHTSDVAHVVFVRIEGDGVEGWGASSPSDVTGETPDSVVAALQRIAGPIQGREFTQPRELVGAMDGLLAGNPSAKAALDVAAFDLVAKGQGVPLHEYLGTERDSALTDRTIGLMAVDDAVAKARDFVRQGFRALKVKLGGDAKEDAERLASIRRTVGSHILLRADANQAFTYRRALQFARQAYPLVVEFFEQPLPAGDLDRMRRLTEACPIPVMADESVLTPEDAAKVVWERCARLVNLKLMKTGGIARATEANAICESGHVPTMVGCNAESQLSIAAGLHFAMSQRNVRFVDLDAHFNLAEDPASGVAFENGYLRPSGKPGLGVTVNL